MSERVFKLKLVPNVSALLVQLGVARKCASHFVFNEKLTYLIELNKPKTPNINFIYIYDKF